MARNCIPRTPVSYTAMKSSIEVVTSPLSGNPRGHIAMQGDDGVFRDYAGTVTNLYQRDQMVSSGGWTSVGSGYHADNVGGGWNFAQFGARIIATNGYDPPQTLLTAVDSVFTDMIDAPKGAYCAVIRDFLFMGYLPSGGAYRVHWSAIGDPTSWPTPGTNAAIQVQSDYQELRQTELGYITGILGGGVGGIDGAVFCTHGIYRVAYVGSPAIFEFQAASGAPGSPSPKSIIRRPVATAQGSSAFGMYLGPDGFYTSTGPAPSRSARTNSTGRFSTTARAASWSG